MKKTVLFALAVLFVSAVRAGDPEGHNKDKDYLYNTPLPQFAVGKQTDNLLYPVWGFHVSASGGISMMDFDDDDWTNSSGIGGSFNAGIFYSLSPKLKIITGLGIDRYSSELAMETFQTHYSMRDPDNTAYRETLSLSNDAVHKISPVYISMPLLLELGMTSVEKVGFYFDFGIRLSYLLSDGYKASGTYSTTGKYGPDLGNVNIDTEVPELGLYQSYPLGKEYSNEEKSEVEIIEEFQNINFSLQGGLGATIPVGEMLLVKVGATIQYGISDISGNKGSERYQYVANSFVTGAAETKTMYFGLELGLYINKRLK